MSKLERRLHTALTVLAILILVVTLSQCANQLDEKTVIVYDSFRQACEQAGGMYVQSLCLTTDNLVELPLSDPKKEAGH